MKMGEFAIAVTIVGVSVIIIAAVIGICKLLGGWSYIKAWVTGTNEETALLAKSEEYNMNGGYIMGSDNQYGYEYPVSCHETPGKVNLAPKQTENVMDERIIEQTTSFVNETEVKQENCENISYKRPRPQIQRGDSLSARLGKGPAPQPPINNDSADRNQKHSLEAPTRNQQMLRTDSLDSGASTPTKDERRRQSSPAANRLSTWGRLQGQSSTESLNSDLPDFIAEIQAGDNCKLKRAMSCDSVSSDTSVVLEALEDTEGCGELDFGLKYDRETMDLLVTVIQAHNLISLDPTSGTLDSYVQVFLLPNKSTSMQTSTHRRTVNPLYKEKFQFHAEESELPNKSLLFRIYSSDKYSNTVIGEAEYKLEDFSTSQSLTKTIPIIEAIKNYEELGEVMFSLSYLPTAERLTIVIVKARNLTWNRNKESSDPFIKVYLLQNGKKMSKKKTSVKKNDKNPIYNEAMIFYVPANRLQTIQLRITVAEYQQDGKAPSIGHVFVGSQTTGKSLSHWNQMMTSLRKPIAMWHPLRK